MQAVVKKVVYSFRYRLGPGQVGREVFHIVLIETQSLFERAISLYFLFFYFWTSKSDVWRHRLDNASTHFRAYDRFLHQEEVGEIKKRLIENVTPHFALVKLMRKQCANSNLHSLYFFIAYATADVRSVGTWLKKMAVIPDPTIFLWNRKTKSISTQNKNSCSTTLENWRNFFCHLCIKKVTI